MTARALAVSSVLVTSVLAALLVVTPARADRDDSEHQLCAFIPGPRFAILASDLGFPCVENVSRNIIRGESIAVCSTPDHYPESTRLAAAIWNAALQRTVGHDIFRFATGAQCDAPLLGESGVRPGPYLFSSLVTDNYPGKPPGGRRI